MQEKEIRREKEKEWEAVFQKLLSELKSKDWLIRGMAATKLGGFEDPRTVDPLVEILSGDESPFVRKSAAESLGNLGGKTAGDALRKAKEREDNLIVLNSIDYSLENLKEEEPQNQFRVVSDEIRAITESGPKKPPKKRKATLKS